MTPVNIYQSSLVHRRGRFPSPATESDVTIRLRAEIIPGANETRSFVPTYGVIRARNYRSVTRRSDKTPLGDGVAEITERAHSVSPFLFSVPPSRDAMHFLRAAREGMEEESSVAQFDALLRIDRSHVPRLPPDSQLLRFIKRVMPRAVLANRGEAGRSRDTLVDSDSKPSASRPPLKLYNPSLKSGRLNEAGCRSDYDTCCSGDAVSRCLTRTGGASWRPRHVNIAPIRRR